MVQSEAELRKKQENGDLSKKHVDVYDITKGNFNGSLMAVPVMFYL